MTWHYSIMHIDKTVATINNEGLCHILLPDFLPYNLYLEEGWEIAVRIENLNNFYYWCASRVLTLDRQYAKEILNAIGAGQGITDRDRASIALSYHCVTLTDVFWTKRPDEAIFFSQISLYSHPLSDSFVDVSLFGKVPTATNTELIKPMDSAGDVSTQGSVPKAWIRRADTFYLLKDGGKRDVDAELLASKIAQCFQVDQVLYEPASYNGTPVSRSRLFTSVRHSIVSIEYATIYAINHDTTAQEMVDACDSYGYHMMNIIDYLVGNTDRHWGNWGFLIDNDTNLPIRLHPLMDLNKSFQAYETLEGARCLTAETPMSQREAALLGVKKVGLNQMKAVCAEWFSEENQWSMFSRRLEILRDV